jgi:DHA3 family macrolide efflux protein-like MFS transporter
MARKAEPAPRDPAYRRLLHNRTLVLLWSGQTISIVGDTFFNLAALWVVYTQSGSALQTAIIQAIWHLPSVLFGPIAGTLADRWDRKRIMVASNVLSAAVVGAVAVAMPARGPVPPVVVFAAIFALNSLNTFLAPARFSIVPEVVGRDLLATATGVFTTIRHVASLLGNALAGIVIAAAGATWAVTGDAVSFLIAALSIAVAALPARTDPPSSAEKRPSLLRDTVDGWRAIADLPVIRAMVWLGVLVNVASFLGPLYPALVSQRLHGSAAAFGLLEAVSVVGAMAGGALAGALERRLGAGRVLIVGWSLAGVCILGMAASTWLALTAVLEATHAFGITAGGVSIGALTAALVPETYRGRVAGITGGVAVVAIPCSALLGGWLADLLGPAPLFAIGGVWMLGVAALARSNRHVRTARI